MSSLKQSLKFEKSFYFKLWHTWKCTDMGNNSIKTPKPFDPIYIHWNKKQCPY